MPLSASLASPPPAALASSPAKPGVQPPPTAPPSAEPSSSSQPRAQPPAYPPVRVPLALAETPPQPLPPARPAPMPAKLPAEFATAPTEPLQLPRLAARPPAAQGTMRPPPMAAFVVELPPAGDLNFFDAPRVVGWAIATGYGGCLWFAPSTLDAPLGPMIDDTTPHRELFIENGALIGAVSTVPGDSLVDFLLPLWSRQQAVRAREAVATIGPTKLREQIAALVDAKLIKRAAATAHISSYVNALCGRALVPGPGRYRVLARALTNNERIEPPLPLRRLLVEGLRRGASLEFLHLRLGQPTTFLRPTAVIGATEGGAALVDIGLSAAEEVALSCFNGRYSLTDIGARARLGEHAVYVLAYSLLCLGAAAVPRLTPRPLPKPPKPGSSTGSSGAPSDPQPAGPGGGGGGSSARPASSAAAPAEPQRAAVGDSDAAIRRVQQKFRQVEESDYFSLLELQPGAEGSDVLRSHQALRAEFLPASLPYRCRSSMDRELRQIARVLDEARLVLAADSSRRSYSSQLLLRDR